MSRRRSKLRKFYAAAERHHKGRLKWRGNPDGHRVGPEPMMNFAEGGRDCGHPRHRVGPVIERIGAP